MERLQSQLTELLQQLPDDTNIGLEVFSTPDRANNRSWAPFRGGARQPVKIVPQPWHLSTLWMMPLRHHGEEPSPGTD